MKKGFKLNRMLSVALCLCLLLSTCVLGTETALAADEPAFSATATADEPQDFVVEHDHDDWMVWNEDVVSSQYIASGNYYLEDDVTLTKTIYYIESEVTLCLNGHTLTSGASFLSVQADATLTLTDCTGEGVITGGTTAPIFVNGGMFILENGAISGNTDRQGGGVYMSKGVFLMKGGSISDNNVNYSGMIMGGGVYVNNGTFIMEGGTISGNEAATGAGVYVGSGDFIMRGGLIAGNNASSSTSTSGGGVYVGSGIFTMESGTISDNYAVYGGGVYVTAGTFTMIGGTVSGNTVKYDGGGVYVNRDTSGFTMENGEISGNTAQSNGGGVYVNDGTFAMKYGTISDSTAQSNGGGVYVKTGTFTMENGTISNGFSTFGGSGVYIAKTGSFTMNGGTISGNKLTESSNTAIKTGGGVYVNGGTFVMGDGTICDNNACVGGGVYMYGGSFTMVGGTISGNSVTSTFGYGGGVYVRSGSFTMEDGEISGNTAQVCGGGVSMGGGYSTTDGVFVMQGGTISDNTAVSNGSGVYIKDGTFSVSGNPVVTGNTLSNGTTESNISLVAATTYINVAGELTDGARLGVNRLTNVKSTPVLTMGYSEYNSDDAGKYFFYDNAESFGNCDVGTGPDGEAWFGYNVTFKDKSGQTLEEQFVGYNCTATPTDDNCWSTEIGGAEFDFDTPITENLTLYSDSETILNPMSPQIRFQRNDDGSYANKFDVRTRAKITDEDFAKYIAETNEEAVKKISKVGFVYSKNSTDFSIADAQKVAMGEKVSGYTDAPVSYIQDADGYYMFTCIITDISMDDIQDSVTAYAYICVEDKWYFYNAETTTVFKDLYDANYPKAAKAYGW